MNHFMEPRTRRQCFMISDESGYVLVMCLFILGILTLSTVAVSMLSQTESGIVRNERIYFDSFYQTESAAIKAVDGYKSWNTFLDSSSSNGHKYEIESSDENGVKAVAETVRIEADGEKTSFATDISEFAKDIPPLKHIDDPLIDSGTGVTGKTFIRRYAVTTESEKGDVQLQVGIYKYIPGGG